VSLTFEQIRLLHERPARDASGFFLVEGEHLVLELQKAATQDARLAESRVYVTPERAGWQGTLPVQVLGARQMQRISQTRSPQGIVAVVPQLPAPALQAGERAIYLHQVQDPGNLGTILRTLAWFGGFRCLTGPGSVDVYNAKVVRASMGAIFHVPVERDVVPDTLPARFAHLACLDLTGEPLTSPAFRGFDCYLFGGEARGIPDELARHLAPRRFTIPGTGSIESLNLATAVSLCQYELHRPQA